MAIGAKVRIGESAIISERCRFGRGVLIEAGAFVGHATRLDARVEVGAGSTLLGGNMLGPDVILSPGVVLNDDVWLAPGTCIGANRVILNDGMVWTFTAADSVTLATMYGTPEGAMIFYDDEEITLAAYLEDARQYRYADGRQQLVLNMAENVQTNFLAQADQLDDVLERAQNVRSQA